MQGKTVERSDERVGHGSIIAHYGKPPGLPLHDFSVNNFVFAYRRLGYDQFECGDVESERVKVVLYGNRPQGLHAARQLPDSRWASKPGESHDIEHLLADSLATPVYESAQLLMSRLHLR